jgi:hypothetical protein
VPQHPAARLATSSPGEAAPQPATSTLRTHLWREATVMVLYVCVIEIAELAALPETHFANGRVTGPVHGLLLGIVWGTAVGLAVAHWFAFVVAASAFHGGRPTRRDMYVGLVQVGAAALVAALCSLPILFLSSVRAQEDTSGVPAVLLGIVGYLLARHRGSSRVASVLYGFTALALGVAVAFVKLRLSAH